MSSPQKVTPPVTPSAGGTDPAGDTRRRNTVQPLLDPLRPVGPRYQACTALRFPCVPQIGARLLPNGRAWINPTTTRSPAPPAASAHGLLAFVRHPQFQHYRLLPPPQKASSASVYSYALRRRSSGTSPPPRTPPAAVVSRPPPASTPPLYRSPNCHRPRQRLPRRQLS